jgi:hypothetical protein
VPIEQVTYYVARCDGCGVTTADLDSEYSAWSDAGHAAEEMTDDGGVLIDGLLICGDCRSTFMATIAEGEEWDAMDVAIQDGKPEAAAALRKYFSKPAPRCTCPAGCGTNPGCPVCP